MILSENRNPLFGIMPIGTNLLENEKSTWRIDCASIGDHTAGTTQNGAGSPRR
jgi:hypothetical protein